MTHPEHTPASPTEHAPASPTTLTVPPDSNLDARSRRARTEAMAVESFGTTLYEVESESGNTYLVDVAAGRCTCPDHVIRGARCKHLRRVAIEITEGRVPPPGHTAVECAVCGEETYVPTPTAEAGPHFCDRHDFQVGDAVRDRETGDDLVVVGVSDRLASEVTLEATDDSVADYDTNADYPADDTVVAAVYPHVRVTDHGAVPASLRVYCFPRSRLERADAG